MTPGSPLVRILSALIVVLLNRRTFWRWLAELMGKVSQEPKQVRRCLVMALYEPSTRRPLLCAGPLAILQSGRSKGSQVNLEFVGETSIERDVAVSALESNRAVRIYEADLAQVQGLMANMVDRCAGVYDELTYEKWATAILNEDCVERRKYTLDVDYALGFKHEPGQPGATW